MQHDSWGQATCAVRRIAPCPIGSYPCSDPTRQIALPMLEAVVLDDVSNSDCCDDWVSVAVLRPFPGMVLWCMSCVKCTIPFIYAFVSYTYGFYRRLNVSEQ